MAAFNNIFINKNMLPLSDAEKELIPDDKRWQTDDDLPCAFRYIYITDEGEFLQEVYDGEPIPANELPKKSVKRKKPLMHQANKHLAPINHCCGPVNFFGDVNGQWYDFDAYFTRGKLQKISHNKYFDFK
ncbi:MAG TPA: hypothetical protein PKW80_15270 [Bacteroidales bacterium]|nr:hypothetical protein [Bacteroidales bacterium]